MSNINKTEVITEKLLKLSRTRTLVKIVIKDSAGDECQYDGVIQYHINDGFIFTIFATKMLSKEFNAEDVERLSVMTEVWVKGE